MKKVMVVEDDPATLEMLGTLLSEAGYEAVLLPRSEGIPEKVAGEKPDLILLDIMIEPKHGMEVLASIVESGPHPPVILMSAAVKGVREMDRIARAMGCYDYIEKPFDVNEMLAKVRSATRGAAA